MAQYVANSSLRVSVSRKGQIRESVTGPGTSQRGLGFRRRSGLCRRTRHAKCSPGKEPEKTRSARGIKMCSDSCHVHSRNHQHLRGKPSLRELVGAHPCKCHHRPRLWSFIPGLLVDPAPSDPSLADGNTTVHAIQRDKGRRQLKNCAYSILPYCY